MAVSFRKTTTWLVKWFFAAWLIVGPWPVDDTPNPRAEVWFQNTSHRLERLPTVSALDTFQVGVAQDDLTPPSPVPLAGFIGQIVQPYEGVDSACLGKALTIATRTSTVTILAADLLLIDERMARSILARTGLARDQIYFSATHTHSGPGGWGNHPLERLVSGSFDPVMFDHLAERIAGVVLASRTRLESAEVAFLQTSTSGLQRNRIIPGHPTNDALSAWVFRSTGSTSKRRTLATLAVFGAHATISHPVPPRLGGDYPSAFAEALRTQVDAGVVLFAAGTVGDSSPVRFPAENQRKSVEAYGESLANSLVKALETAEFRSVVEFTNLGFEVNLPPIQVPFLSPSLRFSPVLCWWIGTRKTYLHILKLGPAFLVGFPGDYSGHLGERLKSSAPIVATSFNGDYKGYLVAKTTFRSYPSYETRWMSFYGPRLGDYLTDLSQACINQILAGGRRSMVTKTEPGRL